MKPLTNVAQAMVSRVVPPEYSSVAPVLLLSHEVWLHKDAHFLLENSYFYVLIISHALDSSTVTEDKGLPSRKILLPSIM